MGAGFRADTAYTLEARSVPQAVAQPYTLAIRGRGESHDLEYRQDGVENAVLTPNGGRGGIGVGAVAFPANLSGTQCARAEDLAPSMGAKNPTAVAFAENSRAELRFEGGDGQTVASLKTGGGKPGQSYPALMQAAAVRRLTPTECARLQGFEDDYLDITYRGRPAADGNKYRALGNSFAVPVVRWIGARIDAQEQQFRRERAHHAA